MVYQHVEYIDTLHVYIMQVDVTYLIYIIYHIFLHTGDANKDSTGMVQERTSTKRLSIQGG